VEDPADRVPAVTLLLREALAATAGSQEERDAISATIEEIKTLTAYGPRRDWPWFSLGLLNQQIQEKCAKEVDRKMISIPAAWTRMLLLTLTTCAVAAQLRAGDNTLDCVVELGLPTFSKPLAYHLPAVAHISVTVGRNGAAPSIVLDPANTPLRPELLDSFGPQSRYANSCAGKTLDFVVRYLVQGSPTQIPVWAVRFRPPSEIVIISHPLTPIIN
jgi:hypothetical protein